ncbi:plasmid mobilization relaxosome protein MobC [Fibrella sp. WM1]|uniref:plasmid mobilization protein n=1 Tax=Fibrella musci TaxID=3242485 RepID=UPI0035207866
MARPPKADPDKRELTIRVRVTAAEKQRIWQQARESGHTPSDYLRVRALAGQALRRVPTPDRAALLVLLAELGKIGSNVNQIARALNSPHQPVPQAEAVTEAMTGVEALTAQLLHLLGDGHSR